MGRFTSFMAVALMLWATTANAGGWPSPSAFQAWAGKIEKLYEDPAIKTNKISEVGSPQSGTVWIHGVWCSDRGAEKVADAVADSFRREFPDSGPVSVHAWSGSKKVATKQLR